MATLKLSKDNHAGASVVWMRVMYSLAIVGAGAVGLTTLLAPLLASQYVFMGATQVDNYLRILAALWLALGATSVLGLFQPIKFSVIFLIQLIYKSTWLTVVAVPSIVSGNRESGLLFLTILFALWVVGLLFAVPFQYLFKHHAGSSITNC
ncbi:MAG: hypothetical protein QNJ46_28550 [Leptolyngbyaceae cyanobacterium MO_188.B28]|nr:hypothetical protein [Leptolyngbyaceae cyanobacterium MO_188.B28]